MNITSPWGMTHAPSPVCGGFNSREECARIIRFACDYAVANGRKKVTLVHKANILKIFSGLFLETGRDIAQEYAGKITIDERIVDACAMQLVTDPWQFDVIVTTNLFGDILSDLTAGLVGGLGMARGRISVRKPPSLRPSTVSAGYCGKNVANPLALLMASGVNADPCRTHDLKQRLDDAITASSPQAASARVTLAGPRAQARSPQP